jgi:hypothetical protein
MEKMYFVDNAYRPKSPLETVGSDFSRVDQEKVDLVKYPKIKQVRYRKAVMEAGDCMFLPSFYVHQVRTYGSSIAMSILVHKLEVFDKQTCSSKSKPPPTRGQPLTLKDFDPRWTFPGYTEDEPGRGKVHLGYSPWKQLRERLRLLADRPEHLNGKVRRRDFKSWCIEDGANNEGTQSLSAQLLSKLCDEGMNMAFNMIGDALITATKAQAKDSSKTAKEKQVLDPRLTRDASSPSGFKWRPSYILVKEIYTAPVERAIRYWATKYDEAR